MEVDEQLRFVELVIDKIGEVPHQKLRVVLLLIVVDGVYHQTSHQELAKLIGITPACFSKRLTRGLISLGRIIRTDKEIAKWLDDQEIDWLLLDHLIRCMFGKPKWDDASICGESQADSYPD